MEDKTYVRPGDFFTVTLPWSEVCIAIRVAEKRMTAELLTTIPPMVQLWEDGRHYSASITTGEAGLYRDDDGYYGYGITDIRDMPECPPEPPCIYFTCQCCGDVAIMRQPICRDCREAGCEPTTDSTGDLGYWNCQRTDTDGA